jgi:hypothetical protein
MPHQPGVPPRTPMRGSGAARPAPYVPLRFTSRVPRRAFQEPREKGTGGFAAVPIGRGARRRSRIGGCVDRRRLHLFFLPLRQSFYLAFAIRETAKNGPQAGSSNSRSTYENTGPAHRGIMAQALGFVHILVSRETGKHRCRKARQAHIDHSGPCARRLMGTWPRQERARLAQRNAGIASGALPGNFAADC